MFLLLLCHCHPCFDQPRLRSSITITTVTNQDQTSKHLSLFDHISRLACWIPVIKSLFESTFKNLSIGLFRSFILRLVRKLLHVNRQLSFLKHCCTWVHCPLSLILLAPCPWQPLGSRTLNWTWLTLWKLAFILLIIYHTQATTLILLGYPQGGAEDKNSQAVALIQDLFDQTSFVFLVTTNFAGTVCWSKHRHTCRGSLRLEVNQRTQPTLECWDGLDNRLRLFRGSCQPLVSSLVKVFNLLLYLWAILRHTAKGDRQSLVPNCTSSSQLRDLH